MPPIAELPVPALFVLSTLAILATALAGWAYAGPRRPPRLSPVRVRDDDTRPLHVPPTSTLEDLTAPMAASSGEILLPEVAERRAPAAGRRRWRSHRRAGRRHDPRHSDRAGAGAGGARATPEGRGARATQGGSHHPAVKMATPRTELSDVRFGDVAGLDDVVEELVEVKEYLLDPERFRSLGAKLPKGILLVGPPGTGKTLLTKALAGEAGVPYQVVSAANLVEVYVGVGAARVHEVFEQARQAAPSIVFLDELDAIGRARASLSVGGQEERESTLNQLLLEMDGFDSEAGVLVVGATNRPDVLDPALLRPGRFDRRLVVDAPDLDGRQAILAVHARNKPLDPDADLRAVARATIGFTGADLANVMNEAALLTGRRRRGLVSMAELEEAVDRVMAGPQRRSRVISEGEKRVVAYHESGHVLASWALGNDHAVHKVSIVSRGRSHGYTISMPTEDRVLFSHSDLARQLAVLLGGRAAEELVFGEPTTGAEDDLRRATRIAHKMVTDYGMSERVGPVSVAPDPLASTGQQPVLTGAEVVGAVDSEVRRLLGESQDQVARVLRRHRSALDALANRLLVAETVSGPEIERLLAGVPRELRGPKVAVAAG
ncbi:MAG TPA: ATP-dependent zinc metalloprotease FtsH [Acidimicrobiales bacterium]|jgi:cell division protease FtsH|nr:ATP-dependent zinc metalloprotease FtsH [Acidimicrobiales bacterium]